MLSIRMPMEQFSVDQGPSRGIKRRLELALDLGDGISVDFPVLQVCGEAEGPSLLVLAGVHGDEYEGIETVLRLFHDLEPGALAGTATFVPTANPLAYREGTRTTPQDDKNMARVFPGDLTGSPTERLAYHLHHRFIAKADFMLDLHSGGTHYAVATLAGYYHGENSELSRQSRAAAEAFGVDLLWAHDEIAPGRTVSSAQSLGVPWIYTEAYGGRRIRKEDSALYYEGTLSLMSHLGLLASLPSPLERKQAQPATTVFGDGNFDSSAVSETDGFFIPSMELKTHVQAGDRIGLIYGLDGTVKQDVRSYGDGMLVMISGTPSVRKGEPLYMLAFTSSN